MQKVKDFKFYKTLPNIESHAIEYFRMRFLGRQGNPNIQHLIEQNKQIIGHDIHAKYDITNEDRLDIFLKEYLHKPLAPDGKTLMELYNEKTRYNSNFENGFKIITDNTNGKVVGGVGFEISKINENTNKINHVTEAIYINPEYRNQGFSKPIIKKYAKEIFLKNINEFSADATYNMNILKNNNASNTITNNLGMQNNTNNEHATYLGYEANMFTGDIKSLETKAKIGLALDEASDNCNNCWSSMMDSIKSKLPCFGDSYDMN